MIFLQNALHQKGPWAEQSLEISNTWLAQALTQRIQHIDWPKAAADVRRFLSASHQNSLKLWDQSFFLEKLNTWMQSLRAVS